MKTLYFDCSSGIAGNMILGALLDLGVPEKYLRQELKKIPLPPYRLIIKKVERNNIKATFFEVALKEPRPGGSKHRHPQTLNSILKIIRRSGLSRDLKTRAVQIYQKLIRAESLVHQQPMDSVHLHEVGATDAIIDIVGTLICLKKLGVNEIYASPINLGSGTIRHSHGILPVPAPATAELLKGIESYGSRIKKELTTPTGAVLIASLAKSFGEIPRIKFEKVGLGTGTHLIPEIPNVLRIILGEKELQTDTDLILEIETNIDDLDPKFYRPAIKKIMASGALDASISPILMKKGRQGIKLTVLCEIFHKDKILEAIFKETTTFGARTYLVKREILKRNFKDQETKYGKVRVKLGILDRRIVTASPEFEDLRKLAQKHRLPASKIYQEIKRSASLRSG